MARYHPVTISVPNKEWHDEATAFAESHYNMTFSRMLVTLTDRAMEKARNQEKEQEITDRLDNLERLILKELKGKG